MFCIKIPARFGVGGGRETTSRDAIAGAADEQGWDLMDGRVMVKSILVTCLGREALAHRHAFGAFWKWESMACEMFTFFSEFSTKYSLFFTSGFAARGHFEETKVMLSFSLKVGLR